MERSTRKVNGNPEVVKLYIGVPWRSGYIAIYMHFDIGIVANDGCIP